MELTLSEIRGALRAITMRQDALEARLDSGACGFCGNSRSSQQEGGSGREVPGDRSTARERELNAR